MHNAKVRLGMGASAAIGTAQRTGSNNVRHVEADVLWIQEHVARRMLPIRKIPGPRKLCDLCTKTVGVALMEQYLGQLRVRFKEERAAVAQQLPSSGQQNVVIASLGVGTGDRPIGGGDGPISRLMREIEGLRPKHTRSSLSTTPAPCRKGNCTEKGRDPRRAVCRLVGELWR